MSSITAHAAAPVVFTDSAAFNTAISSYSKSTLNFDGSVAAGSLIADGGALGGVTFSYNALALQDVSMKILDTWPTTSGTQYLGTFDAITGFDGAFIGGDVFNLSFASANAIGMFFLTGDKLFDGDISLTVGATVASLSSAYETTLSDGSYVYFIGLFDDTIAFSSVDVASFCDRCYEFNVDDIITARMSSGLVPTPSVLWLLLAGLIPLFRNIKSRL